MRARITTSASVLARTLSRDCNDTELVVIRARMSDLLCIQIVAIVIHTQHCCSDYTIYAHNSPRSF